MGKKILIGVIIVAVIGAMITFNLQKNKDGASGEDAKSTFKGKPVEVTAERIIEGEIASSVIVNGNVVEVNKEDVISNTSIEIVDVLVKEGDVLRKGMPMFTVDVSNIENELIKAQINFDIQTLQLEKLRTMSSSNDSAVIGVEIAKIGLASANRAYNKQVESLEKNKTLLEEGIIAQSEYDAMSGGIIEAQSAVNSASLSLKQSQSSVSVSKESTEVDIAIQLKNLESMAMTIAQLEEQIEEIKAVTMAPIDGTVTVLNVKAGDLGQPMSTLLTITDTKELKVTANVREYDIKNIELGQKVILSGDAIGENSLVEGEVTYIASVAQTIYVNGRETTSIGVELRVVNGSEFLKPGYKTECEVMTELKEEATIADYAMLRNDKDGNRIVFLVHEDGRIEERLITLGITSDFDAEVVEGLSPGDVVITNPSYTVKDGMKATITNEIDEEDSQLEGE